MHYTVEQLLSAYKAVADKVSEIETRHKAELSPLKEKLDKIKNLLQNIANQTGTKSLRSEAGTFTLKNMTSYKVEDWQTLIDYVKENNAYHLLKPDVIKGEIDTFIEDTGDTPPGVTMKTYLQPAVIIKRN